MLITIKKLAEKCGVTTETIRNWEKEGKIISTRTQGGHRRFESDELGKLGKNDLTTIKKWEEIGLLDGLNNKILKERIAKYYIVLLHSVVNDSNILKSESIEILSFPIIKLILDNKDNVKIHDFNISDFIKRLDEFIIILLPIFKIDFKNNDYEAIFCDFISKYFIQLYQK